MARAKCVENTCILLRLTDRHAADIHYTIHTYTCSTLFSTYKYFNILSILSPSPKTLLDWQQFVANKLWAWEQMNLQWAKNFTGDVHIVYYDDLVDNVDGTLRDILHFLNFPFDKVRQRIDMCFYQITRELIDNIDWGALDYMLAALSGFFLVLVLVSFCVVVVVVVVFTNLSMCDFI